MPSVTVTRAIAASREEIWDILSDIEEANRWNTAWTRIELLSGQTHGSGTAFRAHTKTEEVFDFEISVWDAPERIAFTPIRNEDSELYSINLEAHAFSLMPLEEGETLVKLAAHASTRGFRGLLLGAFFWRGYQKQGLNTALDSLQALFEGDDEPEADADEITAD
jgi:uncharacterized protein YndB with AHSA1/START domain